MPYLTLRRTAAMAVLLACLTTTIRAEGPATEATGKSLKDSIHPGPKNAGFAMDNYFLWCSSIIKVDDTFHMFASRWPAEKGMGGWTNYSECVRATSKNLLGPYTFQEVVLQKRPDAWDKSRVHNVKIVKAGNQFVIFYINSANQTGYAYSDSITGPWTRSDKPIINASNPAPFVKPDNSLYVFCRLRDKEGVNRGVAFTAPNFKGPYTALDNGDNLLPNGGELEDPTIWWANNQFNIVLNDWKGHATGTGKAGAQYFSKDGIHYTLVSKEPVFTKTLSFTDGPDETFARRERPFIYANEKGEAEAIFTACLPQGEEAYSRIIAQPIDHYVPSNR